jgi:hypothetical protein
MIKKVLLYVLLLPSISLFMTCGGGSGDDESGPVTRLSVTVTYNGNQTILPGGYIGVALNKTTELVNSGGFTLPDSTVMPSSVGQQKDPVKGTPYVIELTSIPVTEVYVFVYLNTDGLDWKPASGEPYIMHNNKSGAIGQEADLITLIEGQDNEITVTFDDSYSYP